jgi:hypothetical protein
LKIAASSGGIVSVTELAVLLPNGLGFDGTAVGGVEGEAFSFTTIESSSTRGSLSEKSIIAVTVVSANTTVTEKIHLVEFDTYATLLLCSSDQ